MAHYSMKVDKSNVFKSLQYPNSKCDLLRRDDMNAKLRLKLKRR
jgi:hypothetical protein